MNYIERIEKLFNSNIRTPEIVKATGLSNQYITNYRNKVSKINNMQLEKAEILIKYIEKLEENKMTKQAYLILSEEIEGEGTTLGSVVYSAFDQEKVEKEFVTLTNKSISLNETGGYTLVITTEEFEDLEEAENEDFRMIKTTYLNNKGEVVTELYDNDNEIYQSTTTKKKFWNE